MDKLQLYSKSILMYLNNLYEAFFLEVFLVVNS